MARLGLIDPDKRIEWTADKAAGVIVLGSLVFIALVRKGFRPVLNQIGG